MKIKNLVNIQNKFFYFFLSWFNMFFCCFNRIFISVLLETIIKKPSNIYTKYIKEKSVELEGHQTDLKMIIVKSWVPKTIRRRKKAKRKINVECKIFISCHRIEKKKKKLEVGFWNRNTKKFLWVFFVYLSVNFSLLEKKIAGKMSMQWKNNFFPGMISKMFHKSWWNNDDFYFISKLCTRSSSYVPELKW